MIRKKNFQRVVAGVISAMLFSSLSGVSALAASKKNNLINIQHSYTNNVTHLKRFHMLQKELKLQMGL